MKKIKVLIVDDEYLERTLLRLGMDWSSSGFEIIGEAESGERALEMIEINLPDIVITDICMPFTDGLQLARVLREKYKNVKVVIVTGHRDFEYAQTAIKLGVTEFLLKPIHHEEVLEVCLKIKKEIEIQRSFAQEINGIKNQWNENLHLIRENFFADLIMGNIEEEDAKEKFTSFNIEFLYKEVVCIFISLNFKQADGKDKIKKLQVVSMGCIKENTRSLEHCISFYKNENEIAILIGGQALKFVKIDGILEKLLQDVKEAVNCDATIGVGNIQEGIEGIALSYKEAKEAVRNREGQDVNEIFFYNLKKRKKTNEMVEKAKTYIEDTISNCEMSLSSIASYLFVNQSYLSRVFKAEVGENISEYIMKQRIHKSIFYLKNTGLKAYEIAEKVGIGDAHYFSICFKKYMGKSINEYKKEM